ncbi:hypothetical protein SLS53_006917 [Cytospora paraplurivora]|uniref:Uncharacterized protein n=1 Tax=Cytospora paraplurivora TaxID=2898453 RepID=A0AAN9YEC0_9PEZI
MVIVYTMSRYDDALDADKLYNSLECLVARKGWRKLGARLRKNAEGGFEYHIPAVFTQERPAVEFSKVRHNMPISEHPLASQLPKSSTRPAVVGDPVQFKSLAIPPSSPSSMNDYLTKDRGQLGLHVVSFNDATLVCLYYNHTSFDLMGWGAILTAWTHELHGRGDQIETPLGGDPGDGEDFDPMSTLGLNPTESHILEERKMSIPGLLGFGLRNALDLGFYTKECRIVCIPGAFVDRLHTQALEELKAEAARNNDGTGPEPFLSHGDVLTAWWARLMHAASARKTLSSDFETSTRPYISNLFTMLYSLIPARELLAHPVSWLAKEIRRAIVEQGTREQVDAYFALQRQAPGRILPVFGDTGMHLMSFSNWSKAEFYGHDFSPARVGAAGGAPLYPSYVQSLQIPVEVPEGVLIIGQDKSRNYWLYGYRVKGLWEKVDQALKEMDYTP